MQEVKGEAGAAHKMHKVDEADSASSSAASLAVKVDPAIKQLLHSLADNTSKGPARLPNRKEILATHDAFELGVLSSIKRTELGRDIDGVIVVVNDNEWRVAKIFLHLEYTYPLSTFSGQNCFIAKFRGAMDPHRFLLVRLLNNTGGGSSGADGSQALVDAVLQQFSPRFVVGVGCAGSWNQQTIKLADVLVSTVTAPYSFRKGDQSRNLTNRLAPDLHNMLRNQAESWRLEKQPGTEEAEPIKCKVHFGAVLSGDKLVVTQQDKADMQALLADKATEKIDNEVIIGAEMEGTGVAAACSKLKIPNAIIKGPSDFCAGKAAQKGDDKEEAQVRASFAAFHFFRHAFSSALAAKVLPPHWKPLPLVVNQGDAITKPIQITAAAAGYPEVEKLVKHMRTGNEKLIEDRKKEPSKEDVETYEKLLQECKDLNAKKDEAYKKVKKAELGKAWEAQRTELSTEVAFHWDAHFSSNVLHVDVESRQYSVERQVELDRVKWSAKQVEKYVSPPVLNQMLHDLRGDAKFSVTVKDRVSGKELPEKAEAKPRASKKNAAAAGGGDD